MARKLVIATEVSDERLQTLKDMFAPLAAKQGRTIAVLQPDDLAGAPSTTS